jgi:hypothetical protein
MLTNTTKKLIKNAITNASDNITFRKNGEIVVRRSYFYKHGMDSAQLAERCAADLKAAGFNPVIVSDEDKWAAWPKTSYFVATLKLRDVRDVKAIETVDAKTFFSEVARSMRATSAEAIVLEPSPC